MNSCPYCKHDIDAEIRKYFWSMLPEVQGGTYFDFTCPYCEHPVEIEIISNPDFKVLEPDRRRVAGGHA